MKTRINFLGFSVIASVLYILLYILFDDAFIYWIGGLIGSFLKLFSETASSVTVGVIWLVLIGLFIAIANYLKNDFKFLILIIIGLLLYLIDFMMYEFLVEGYNYEVLKYVISIVKGFILGLIWYVFLRNSSD